MRVTAPFITTAPVCTILQQRQCRVVLNTSAVNFTLSDAINTKWRHPMKDDNSFPIVKNKKRLSCYEKNDRTDIV